MTALRRNLFIALIIVAFIGLGTTYSVVTPLFEAPDEDGHYTYVKYMAEGQGLPVISDVPTENEVSVYVAIHPPLYYGLAALGTFWIEMDDLEDIAWYNPHFDFGVRGLKGNKNALIHTREEAFPYHGSILTVHIARLISVLLGAAAVLATYLIALEILPNQRWMALGAAAINAFNPQFLFISARMGNDAAVAAFCSLTLWAMLRFLNRKASVCHLILLGVLLGLACLSKASALGLLPLTVVAIAIKAYRQRSFGAFVKWSASIFGVAFLVAGWWYLRNWFLYRDPLAWKVQLPIIGLREFTLGQIYRQLGGLEISFWAVFGWMNIAVEETIYRILGVVTRIAALGLLLLLARRFTKGQRDERARPGIPLLGLWFAILCASLLRFMRMQPGAQGRYLFPTISVVSISLLLGLSQWVPRGLHKALATLLGGAFFLFAIICPFRYIAPAYARPPILSPDELPPDLTPLHVNYDGKIELLGCKLEAGSSKLKPGDSLPVTLCWQSLAEMEEDYSVFVHLFGRDEQPLGQVDTYPGLGSYPTSLWRKGDIICESHRVPISKDAICPTACRVDVGLYQLETMEGLPAYDEEGRPLGRVSVGRAKLTPQKWPKYTIENPLQSNLAGKVSLIGFKLDRAEVEPGGELKLTLYWKALAGMGEDYTVFTHLIDEEGEIWAQDDGQPLGGYYPTSLWGEGEVIEDEYTLTLSEDTPENKYWMEVGMYLLHSGQRLPIINQEGEVKGDRILLGPVKVVNL